MELLHLPVRAATGAFILNSGLSKRNLEGQAAAQMHGWTSSSIPALGQLKPEVFVRLLSGTEVALGTALLVPVVPSALVGVGLVASSAGLLKLYLKTPGMRQEGSLRPTEQGNGWAGQGRVAAGYRADAAARRPCRPPLQLAVGSSRNVGGLASPVRPAVAPRRGSGLGCGPAET
jgi:hypothetical protein